MELFRPLAEKGESDAQYALGLMYVHGQGVPEDGAAALKWYLKAADQGMVNAQYNLALLYANGEGVDQNKAEAAEWFRRAADQGLPQAWYNLGIMHAKGDGVPLDEDAAITCFYNAGVGFLQAGERDPAQTACDSINAISPGHAFGMELSRALNP